MLHTLWLFKTCRWLKAILLWFIAFVNFLGKIMRLFPVATWFSVRVCSHSRWLHLFFGAGNSLIILSRLLYNTYLLYSTTMTWYYDLRVELIEQRTLLRVLMLYKLRQLEQPPGPIPAFDTSEYYPLEKIKLSFYTALTASFCLTLFHVECSHCFL